MILGLGSDLVDIRRIERLQARFGERFVVRIFTPQERAKAESRKGAAVAATYAKRFAAKEACAKALGSGFAEGLGWHDISVVNDALGRPALILEGVALARLAALTPEGHAPRAHLTLADEYPYATAQVILEAVPLAQASVLRSSSASA